MIATNIEIKDSEIILFEDLFSDEYKKEVFNPLLNDSHWKQETIKMFGKEIKIPRMTAWYGDEGMNYSYSGINNKPNAWNEILSQIKDRVEEVTGYKFNSCLLNYYRDGNDSVSWHQDNEKELGINPVIASLTFGGERNFQLRHIDNKKEKINISLGDGKLLLMAGETQHNWEHQIPKTKKTVEPRINLTFRYIY